MEFERTYTIPLRKGMQKAPRHRRAKKAISVLRAFTEQHAKSDKIVIGEQLNEHIWDNGMKNPPASVQVTMRKDKDGTVYVNMIGQAVKSE